MAGQVLRVEGEQQAVGVGTREDVFPVAGF